MEIKKIEVEKLKLYKNNPRKIRDDVIKALSRSIQLYGFNQPIIVDKNLRICVGHARWLAAKKVGLKEIPVIMKDFKDEKEFISYNLADNKIGELNKWDEEKLEVNILELEKLGINIDSLEEIEPLGFLNDEEILDIIRDKDIDIYNDKTENKDKDKEKFMSLHSRLFIEMKKDQEKIIMDKLKTLIEKKVYGETISEVIIFSILNL